MNEFRSRTLTGKSSKDGGLLNSKSPRNKQKGSDNLESVTVPRTEARTVNHRDAERHRLVDDRSVSARFDGTDHAVTLINLSGGGAMIEAPFRPELWDRIELDLGSGEVCGRLECAVRWIKGDRIGLEFAHETRIEADPATRSNLLRQVLTTSFPEVCLQAAPAAEPVAVDEPKDNGGLADHSRRADPRHPLIWIGEVHFDHDTTPVRLRNISARGALVEGGPGFPVGAELLLDLDEAGTHFASVCWVQGDQAGLAFRSPFDLAALARSKPQVAPSRWSRPAYLGKERESSPWAPQWGRLSLSELHKKLDR